MNKTQRINYQAYQNEIIATLNGQIDDLTARLESENDLVVSLVEQADSADKHHSERIAALVKESQKQVAAEKKAATEAATLKSIRDGFVPIEVLRHLVREEYKTTHNSSFTKTDLTVMLDGARPVDKAILAALLEKPAAKKGYANGGFTNPSPFSPFQPGDKVSILKHSVDPGSLWLVRGVA